MKKYLSTLGFATAALLFAGQVMATPVTITPSFEGDLQGDLNNITVSTSTCSGTNPGDCPSSTNVQTDQVAPSSYWAVSGSGGSVSTFIISWAGNTTAQDAFGIFDATNPANTIQLMGTNQPTGTQALLTIAANGDVYVNFALAGHINSGNLFGFYLTAADLGTIVYSDSNLNADQLTHMVAYEGNNSDTIQIGGLAPGTWSSNEYILGWEDSVNGVSNFTNFDFADFVAMVESVHPVPEPSAIALFGLGLLALGFAVRFRRRMDS